MTDSDSDPTRERASRELSPAPPSAQAREFVLPANAPQTRAAERVDEPDWRTLFAGPSSRATLARISNGDPLGLEQRCRERIAARALLIDLERAVQCVLANVAFFAPRYKGSPPFEYWLRQRVDAGLARVLEDEAETERALMSFALPGKLHSRLGDMLGFDSHLARRACVVLNSMPYTVRRVFVAVMLDGQALDRLPALGFGTKALVERRLRAALESVSCLQPMGVLPEDGGVDEE